MDSTIRRIAIRVRVAPAIGCIENPLARFHVQEGVAELVTVMWGFVEKENLAAVDGE